MRKRIFPAPFAQYLTAGLLSVCCSTSLADIGVTASAEFIENPQRLPDPPADDMLATLAIDGNIERETTRFLVSLDYIASKNDYQENLMQDRDLVEGTGLVRWKISPDLLSWDLSNTRSNQLIDASRPDFMDNRQVISTTTTGPTLTLPVGAANMLTMQANFTQADYEQSGFLDQDRGSIYVDFSRNLTRNIVGSLRGLYNKSEFKADFVSTYEISSLSANFVLEQSPYTASLELGQFRTERTGFGSSSNPLLRADFEYTLTTFSSITLGYAITVEDLLTDIASRNLDPAASLNQDFQFEGRFGNSNNSGIYERETKSVAYNYADPNGASVTLSYEIDDRDFINSFDRQMDERYAFNIGYQFSPRLDANFRVRLSNIQLNAFRPVQERLEIGLRGRYTITHGLIVNFGIRHEDQQSEFAPDNYDGLISFLGITFRR